MLCRAVATAIAIGLPISAAEAGQASGSFQVGVTIGAPKQQQHVSDATYTWGAAAISVKRAGFEELARIERSGTLYWFSATRDGVRYRIAVSVTNGAIVGINPA
jgi:hypothetical protein